jgi:GGDEF domain-containing protein
MRFNLLSDADWDSKIDKVLDTFSDFGYRRFFEEKNYGNSLDGITVVFMCRNPEHNFKQRIKHSKAEKKVYLDIMLDLNQFKQIEQRERERIVAQKLISEIPPIIDRYKFNDFDLPNFEIDLRKLLKKIKWL